MDNRDLADGPFGQPGDPGVLVDVARVRHGDLAVLRALTRRERDPVQARRVF